MSERWVARATGRHLNGGELPNPFSADDLFPDSGPPEALSPAEESRSRFQFLKKPDVIRVGGKSWVVVNDLGSATEKFLGEPDYFFNQRDAALFYATCRPDGVVEISKAAKKGVRAVGKVLAKGLLE